MNAASKAPETSSSSYGMHGLPLIPFPFLNPWNWGAITPPRAAAAGLVMLRMNLDAWRSMTDAFQATLRAQQNAALTSLESQCLALSEQTVPLNATSPPSRGQSPAPAPPA